MSPNIKEYIDSYSWDISLPSDIINLRFEFVAILILSLVSILLTELFDIKPDSAPRGFDII